MKYIKTYLPFPLILIAFLIGRYSKDDTSPELIAKWQEERKTLTEAISQKDAQIIALAAESEAIREKMYLDSLKFSEALNANKRAYNALKKRYNEINLNRADRNALDSIITRLYSE